MKKSTSAFAIVLLLSGYALAQHPKLVPLDESQFTDSAFEVQSTKNAPAASQPAAAKRTAGHQAQPALGPEPQFESSSEETGFQNAVIEGVQVSSEPGNGANEKVVSSFFIFRDKPSSFFYDVQLKEKKIVFEFNDTKTGAAPINSSTEPPITGFTVEQRKIDINKEVRGLKPEWHNQVRIVFKVDKMPKIRVNDEYNVISFSYKWTTDSKKEERYEEGVGPNIALWSGVALGTLATAGYVIYRIIPPPVHGNGQIPIDDIPLHQF